MIVEEHSALNLTKQMKSFSNGAKNTLLKQDKINFLEMFPNAETGRQSREIDVLAKQAYNIGRALVLPEFVAKLKACATIENLSLHGDEVVYVEDIDRILREMMEDGR